MALDAGGYHAQASAAYAWLAAAQRPDGSWASSYREGRVVDATGEAHHAAYVAVGVWHHALATGDDQFLVSMWATVRRGLDWVVGLQGPQGQVWWAASPTGDVDELALTTGSASVHHGLLAGLAIAARLGQPVPHWRAAAIAVRHALVDHTDVFADRSRYSMDWYYPMLGCAVTGPAGWARLIDRWDEFIVPGLGIRCVTDRPWVTGAETCELALAVEASGRRGLAAELVCSMQHLRHDDGAYWTGLVVADGVRWPVERTTWTSAAMVLAVDALADTGPHSAVFRPESFAHLLGGDLLPVDHVTEPWDCPSCAADVANRTPAAR